MLLQTRQDTLTGATTAWLLGVQLTACQLQLRSPTQGRTHIWYCKPVTGVKGPKETTVRVLFNECITLANCLYNASH